MVNMYECKISISSQETVSESLSPADIPKDIAGSETSQLIPLLPAGEKMFKDIEHSALLDVACSNGVTVNKPGPVSLFDLLHTLQKNRRLVPVHSVYSLNVERLLSRLNHPGRDD